MIPLGIILNERNGTIINQSEWSPNHSGVTGHHTASVIAATIGYELQITVNSESHV